MAVPGMGMEIPGKMPARYPEYTKNHPEIMFLTFRTRKEVSEFLNEIEP